MERVQIAQDDEKNDVWKQLLSLSAAASKGSTGLCGNNLSVRGSKGEGAGGEKCTGRKTCGCDTD